MRKSSFSDLKISGRVTYLSKLFKITKSFEFIIDVVAMFTHAGDFLLIKDFNTLSIYWQNYCFAIKDVKPDKEQRDIIQYFYSEGGL